MERLERSGFALSPGDRVRLLRVLEGPAKLYIKEPQRLKYLLCPVVARTAAEQDLFYEIFDKWWAEVSAPLVITFTKRKTRIPWAWLIGILLTIGLGFLASLFFPSRAEPLVARFNHTQGFAVGDTFVFVNETPISLDSNTISYQWDWIDDATGTIEKSSHSATNWSFVLDTLPNGAAKTVRLIASSLKNGLSDTASLSIEVLCANTPRIVDIIIPEVTSVGKQVRFEVEIESRPGLLFEWDFGDGSQSNKRSPSHLYQKEGQYNVTLLATDTLASGTCIASFSKAVSFGVPKAFLVAKPLNEEKLSTTAVFGWATFVLLGILGLFIVYCWVKWAIRKPPPIAPTAPLKIDSPDRAPYFIPWRAQEGQVQVSRELFRLGDALRLRQEGLRRSIDVPATVKGTIEKGGFPALRFRYNTRPTDYLCLVDEQTHVSHQARLFKYLVEMLRNQDVHLELFFYDTDFNRYWNRNYPAGVGLEVLQRLYPEHRLVVLGDAHSLLDPRVDGQPRLRPEYTQLLRTWRQRLLLTPLPPNSWTFREGLLYSFFALFPADLRGQSEAATYVEAGLDAEDLPSTFTQWHNMQQLRRREPEISYRRWRTWDDHLQYLANYPQLALWLQALSVYPSPTWEVTIAIGKALEPKGVVLNFDNLLLLARIPWLQNGRFEPRLRDEMLKLLDPEVERLARDAVRRELEAVRENAKQGHANQGLETDLAVQNFALDPDSKEHQEAIQFLLEQGLINPKREAELNQVVTRHINNTASSMQSQKKTKGGFFNPKEEDLRTFLEKRKEEPKAPEKPFFTPMFMWAAGLSVLFIFLWVFCWMLSGSNTLKKWVRHPAADQAAMQQDTALRNYYFVKEIYQIDSAEWYNNRGVRRWYGEKDTAVVADFRFALASKSNRAPADIQMNRDALVLAEQSGGLDIYPLAESNWGKVYYNAAVLKYTSTFNDSLFRSTENLRPTKRPDPKTFNSLKRETGEDVQFEPQADKRLVLRSALQLFSLAAAFDSTAADALHGMGLCYFYLNERDLATTYYNYTLTRTDSLFFDTLKLAPNLETLLGIRTSRITDVRVVDATPERLTVAIDYYFETDKYKSLDINLAPLDNTGQLARSFSAAAARALPGVRTDTLTLRKPAKLSTSQRTDSLRVRLIAPKSRALIAEKVVAYNHTWGIESRQVDPSSNKDITIRGQVVNLMTSKIVPGAKVEVTSLAAREPMRMGGSGVADERGIFTIKFDNRNTPLEFHEFLFKIEMPGFENLRKTITWAEIQKTNLPVFKLTPTGPGQGKVDKDTKFALTVEVIDETTNDIASNALIEVTAPDALSGEFGTYSLKVDKDKAQFNFEKFDRYTIKVTKDGYITSEETITLKPEETNYVHYITLKKELAQNAPPPSQEETATIYFEHNEPQKLRKGLMKELQDLYSSFYSRKELYKKRAAGKSNNSDDESKKIEEFFEKRVRAGFSDLQRQLQQVKTALDKGSRVQISLKGFCSPQEGINAADREELSRRRIKVVGDFILNYNKGELGIYIKTGAINITEQPQEASKTQISPPKDSYNPDNFDLNASLERKVEILISIGAGQKGN